METYDKTNFEDFVKSKRTVLAYFLMKACPFCVEFNPMFEKESSIEGVEFVKVDISDESSPLWDKYVIDYVPTLIVFKEGKIIHKAQAVPMVGLGKKDLDVAISKAVGP